VIEYIVANLVDFLLLLLCWVLVAALWVLPFVIYFYTLYGIYCLCEKFISYIKKR